MKFHKFGGIKLKLSLIYFVRDVLRLETTLKKLIFKQRAATNVQEFL